VALSKADGRLETDVGKKIDRKRVTIT